MLRRTWIFGWAIALAAGCTVGPDYRAPEASAPNLWLAEKTAAPAAARLDPASLRSWWKRFGDERLDRLIERALADNPDLGIALARIEQSRALRQGARAELFPRVGAATGAQRQNNPFPGLASGIRYNLFELGFDALWEIDLFGRQRRKLEAAAAEADASEAQYAQALTTLTADLGRSYVEYRSLQNRLRIARDTLEAQRHTLRLTERLFGEGLGSRHDVVRARAQATDTAAQIPVLDAEVASAARQIEFLAGAEPGALAADLNAPGPVPSASGDTILATPAAVLRHRPDIRNAERRLAAATALQGAAIAERFPKISLSAFLGLRNVELETLFKSAAFSYGTAANLLQPLFNAGRIQAGVDLADARQKEAYLAWRKTVLDALRETESAWARYVGEAEKKAIVARAVEDLRESVELSKLRYREGVASFLEVLDAQRALYAADMELALSEAAVATDLIAVYKALGGGANASEPPETASRGK